MTTIKQYTPVQGYSQFIHPEEFGIAKLHFGILNLSAHSTYFDHTDDCEVVLITLGGKCTLLVGHNGNKANGTLGERPNVFNGKASVAYIPHHTTYEILTQTDSVEIAIGKTPSHSDIAAVILNPGYVYTDENYQLYFSEDDTPTELDGEVISFYRFQDENETTTVHLIDNVGNKENIVLGNNQILFIPEKYKARLISNEDNCYQLSIRSVTPLQ